MLEGTPGRPNISNFAFFFLFLKWTAEFQRKVIEEYVKQNDIEGAKKPEDKVWGNPLIKVSCLVLYADQRCIHCYILSQLFEREIGVRVKVLYSSFRIQADILFCLTLWP